MFATLFKQWEMLDGSGPRHTHVMVQPGRYELERVPNPNGHPSMWLVLKGTLIGMAEGAWRQWADFTDEWKITIEE